MRETLDKIDLNKEVIIVKVKGLEEIKRRFLDLGFIPGEKVECVLLSPFKSPHAYKINNTVIAIRNKDARNIEVKYEKD